MSEHVLTLPSLHPGQKQIASELAKFNIIACGRRWGKTTFAEKRAIEVAVKGFPVAWSAPTYKNLREPFDRIRRRLDNAGLTKSANKSEMKIELITGGSIKFWTHEDENLGRGEFYKLWVDDEAAHAKGLGDHFEKAILPTLTDLDGEYLAISTPNGLVNDFTEFYRRGQNDDYPDWASWQMPTNSNPTIKNLEAFLERAKKEMIPTHFRQEYLAQFESPKGAVFDTFSVDKNTCAPFDVRKDARVYLGVDFGPANTAMCAVGERDGIYYVTKSYHGAGDEPETHIARFIPKIPTVKAAFGGAKSEQEWRDRWSDAGVYIAEPSVTGPNSFDIGLTILYRLIDDGKLVIFNTEQELINEIVSYRWKMTSDNKVLDMVEDKSTYHRLDALRYVMVSIVEDQMVKSIGGRFDRD